MTAALPDWTNSIHGAEPESAIAIKSIVLPLDGSEHSRTAIPVARRLADLYGATLHVTYVGKGRFDRRDAATQLGFTAETSQIVFEQSSGNPAELVTRLIRELQDSVIVISTDVRPQQRNRFDPLTESIFATKPQRAVVLTDLANTPWRLRKILLAHDGTPISHPATGPAADLALRADADVITVHVAARGEERPDAPGSIAAPFYVDQPQHEWPAWAQEFMNRVIAGGAPASDVQFKMAVTGGQAGSELAKEARQRDVDIVVMAWHGHWHEHQDCATRVVIRNAGCPVMLVYSAS